MNKITSLLMALFFTLNTIPSFGEDSKPPFNKNDFIASAGSQAVLSLSITDCIMYAFKNNSEVRIKKLDPKKGADDVKIAESAFEPTFGIEYLINSDTQLSFMPFITGSEKSVVKDTYANASVQGRITTGATYSLELSTDKHESDSIYQTINPAYLTNPQITVTQPILKGAGININRSYIVIAQNGKKQSEMEFQNTLMDTITRTKTAYYNYIHAVKAYSIAKLSLKRARNLMRINKARYNKGLISTVDLLETESALVERRKFLITVEGYLKKAEDYLKIVTNIVDDPKLWDTAIKTTTKLEVKAHDLDLVRSLESAFAYRPDYEIQQLSLDNTNVLVNLTHNGTLPELDVLGSYGLNGLGDSYGNSFNDIDTSYNDWMLGIKLSVPWGTGDRAKYDKAKLQKEQALLGLQRLEQNIILDVRDKVREVDVQYRQVKASLLSKKAEKKNYEAQKERYTAGQVSTHDILDYQDKLAQTELDYTKALINYHIALANLDNAEGMTLVKNDIKIEEK